MALPIGRYDPREIVGLMDSIVSGRDVNQLDVARSLKGIIQVSEGSFRELVGNYLASLRSKGMEKNDAERTIDDLCAGADQGFFPMNGIEKVRTGEAQIGPVQTAYRQFLGYVPQPAGRFTDEIYQLA